MLSRLLLPPAPEGLLDRFEREREHGEVATATIVLHELRFGADLLPARSRRRRVLLAFIETQVESMPVLPYDAPAAAWHAAERARLARQGAPPPFVDSQIAAIAAVNGLTLVTASARHFRAFRGLRVASW